MVASQVQRHSVISSSTKSVCGNCGEKMLAGLRSAAISDAASTSGADELKGHRRGAEGNRFFASAQATETGAEMVQRLFPKLVVPDCNKGGKKLDGRKDWMGFSKLFIWRSVRWTNQIGDNDCA